MLLIRTHTDQSSPSGKAIMYIEVTRNIFFLSERAPWITLRENTHLSRTKTVVKQDVMPFISRC
jgi:hypothetical protein